MEYNCLNNLFRNAHLYREFFSAETIREPHAKFGHSERHLQCVWFDENLRPKSLKTINGEPIEVVDAGSWNLEAGPDFKDAVILIGEEKRRFCGDVEIHISSNDWTRHHHAKDVRYKNVLFHVTFYADESPEDLPKNVTHISLAEPIRNTPNLHLEDIDLAAYPFNKNTFSSATFDKLRALSFNEKCDILEAAGEERLRKKAENFSNELKTKTADQIFYEQTMYALGFKNNRIPLRELAKRITTVQLQKIDVSDSYSLLAGVANLLPSEIKNIPAENQTFARECWEHWFKLRYKNDDLIMQKSDWQIANLRPLNSPIRRLAAAAVWFSNGSKLFEEIKSLAENEPEKFAKESVKNLTAVSHPFWSFHETWNSAKKERPIALVGKARADAILINVITPMLAALNYDDVFRNNLLRKLPAEQTNSIIRETAHRLFGVDHPSSLYKTELARQGLIQIFQDFCLSRKSV